MTRDLLPGTMDMMILKALSLGPEHGYGVLGRIEAMSEGQLSLEQGSLYPALNRLEHRGMIASKWGLSDNNRKARYYRLTAKGERQLKKETARWAELVRAVSLVMNVQPSEA